MSSVLTLNGGVLVSNGVAVSHGGSGGGGYFTVTDTTDTAGGTIRTITPTAGTAVIQSNKTVEITNNGTTTISPDVGNTALGSVTVTTNVSGGSGGAKHITGTGDEIVSVSGWTDADFYEDVSAGKLLALQAEVFNNPITLQCWGGDPIMFIWGDPTALEGFELGFTATYGNQHLISSLRLTYATYYLEGEPTDIIEEVGSWDIVLVTS